jgi:low affinity Fe/Cu permease
MSRLVAEIAAKPDPVHPYKCSPDRNSIMNTFSQTFSHFAEKTSRYAGKPAAFLLAVVVVIFWAASGPLFHFGDTWQLVINTSTTIVTFLMVFLIQNSQNREGASLHIKLDELIRVSRAKNVLLNLEDLDEDALDEIRQHYRKLAERRNTEPEEPAVDNAASADTSYDNSVDTGDDDFVDIHKTILKAAQTGAADVPEGG